MATRPCLDRSCWLNHGPTQLHPFLEWSSAEKEFQYVLSSRYWQVQLPGRKNQQVHTSAGSPWFCKRPFLKKTGYSMLAIAFLDIRVSDLIKCPSEFRPSHAITNITNFKSDHAESAWRSLHFIDLFIQQVQHGLASSRTKEIINL